MKSVPGRRGLKGNPFSSKWVRVFGCALLLASLFATSPLSAQQDDFQRSLETFDRRAEQVRTIVDSSRIPEANALFESAIRSRDQAEAAYRQGNSAAAKTLLDRAFTLLVQAENRAREGGVGEAETARLIGLLKSLRQSLQDSQRWLREIEIQSNTDDRPGSVQSFLAEQKERTKSLLDRAERECADANSDRCRDLLNRAGLLFERAEQLLDSDLDPVGQDGRAAENRLRDARQFLDKAQEELDQIQREIQGQDRPNAAVVSRIRNVENLVRLGNDRLQEADSRSSGLQQGQSGVVLNLLRRAGELGQAAVRTIDGGAQLEKEFEERAERVEGIRRQVETLAVADPESIVGYQDGVNFQALAEQQAQSENYEQALQSLSRAATAFNHALAQASSNSGAVNADQVYQELKSKFEGNYSETLASAPSDDGVRTACSERLILARESADRSEEAHEAGDPRIALSLLNRAQQALNEAKGCLGQSTAKVVGVLDRLQTQFDRRVDPIEEAFDSDAGGSSALLEAKSLRRLSDVQEAQGDYEGAIQSVGRALQRLGDWNPSAPVRSERSDEELLASFQARYDQRASRVRELAGEAGDSAVRSILEQADRMRNESERAREAGDARLGLSRISQAIGLLEQATR